MPTPRFDVLIPDLNGILRGLSAPIGDADKLLAEEVAWSSSLFASRFDGAVVEESGYGLSVGDPDFPLRAVEGSDLPVPWGVEGSRQGLFRMFRPSGEGFELDPQEALLRVLGRLAEDGLRVVLATEFEFYLNEGGGDGGAEMKADGLEGFCDLYSVDEISRQSGFFSRLNDYAAAQGLPVGNVISEYGAGQWEVNLAHREAMAAVLDGLLLRRLVRATAAQEGRRATFMAKPHGGCSGSGMHVHISVWRDGRNCFADEEVLRQAVAGVLAVMGEGMAFFAPFDNSFRRFMPGSYAPCEASWGRENRSVAVRVPMASADEQRRLEFRLCGADANPVLATAALLAGVHYGMSEGLAPPPAHEDGSAGGGAPLALSWRAALDDFARAALLPRYFDERFLANYLCVKENEWRHHRSFVSDYDRVYYGRII